MIRTKPFMTLVTVTLLASIFTAPSTAHAQGLYRIGHTFLGENEGEILDYLADGGSYYVATTSGIGAKVFTLGGDGSLSLLSTADFGVSFSTSTSVALDPLGRGFGVVSLLPDGESDQVAGTIGFFDYTTGAMLHTVSAGFHPDSVKFSADGQTLYIANEGEFGIDADENDDDDNAVGSIGVIDLSGITGVGDVNTAGASLNFDFSDANLADAAAITQRDGLRNNSGAPVDVDPITDSIEPEFMTIIDGKVFVSLQEANAVGVFDPTTQKWERFIDLGTEVQTIDASNRDGAGNDGALMIDDEVAGLRMPDTIASVEINGKKLIFTANEGDARPDDGDIQRFKDFLGFEAGVTYMGMDFATAEDDDILGRLNLSIPDSDPDGNGLINEIVMLGTRGFSIFDADTGTLVGDSGSFESFIASVDPLTHNINDADLGEFDQRSDDKGPEPEGLSVIVIDGELFVAIGFERQNSIILNRLDLSDMMNITIAESFYLNDLGFGLFSPESLLFVDAANSPTGHALLLAGYEGVGDGVGNGIGVYSTVPEPTTAVLAVGGMLALAARRRRRAA